MTVGNGKTIRASDAVDDVPEPSSPDLDIVSLSDLSDDRVQALKDEIARRSMSIQALESIAQEFPNKRDSLDPEDSMLHTDIVSLGLSENGGDGLESMSPGSSTATTLDPKVRDPQAHKRDSNASKSSRDSMYDHTYINQFIQKGLSDSVGSNTSKVIAGLQNTIDTLRRELKDQNAKYIEAKKGRDALSKRCDNQNQSMESLKHQNEMLNTMIERKERQIHDVEHKMAVQKSRAHTLEKEHADNEARMIDMEERTAAAEDKYKHLQASADASADGHRRKEEYLRAEFKTLQESITAVSTAQAEKHQQEEEWRQDIISKLAREEELRNQIRKHQLDFETLAAQRETKIQSMLAEFKKGIQGHGSTVDETLLKLEQLSRETTDALEVLKKSQRELVKENDELRARESAPSSG
ncbi:SWI5-dependent HO expression protein 3 [Yarrowia sp. C11]|nr:SWI5-dependent HO expression protein 3 [Yarrowia sp. C11]KAG5363976.1 SWI5-dependent HO expression protein 3 [Yarrowia sp. E02]